MDRRQFFRHALSKGAEVATEAAEQHVRRRASHWLRPPFALGELEFLLTCTRCGDCVAACPHQLLFPLPARLGVQVAGTPAMDLLNKACRLCDDWPCVAACEPGALHRAPPDTDNEAEPPLPRLALAEIDPAACLPYTGPECGACRDSCPVAGALAWDGERPRIDALRCTGCALCRAACVASPKAVSIRALPDEGAET